MRKKSSGRSIPNGQKTFRRRQGGERVKAALDKGCIRRSNEKCTKPSSRLKPVENGKGKGDVSRRQAEGSESAGRRFRMLLPLPFPVITLLCFTPQPIRDGMAGWPVALRISPPGRGCGTSRGRRPPGPSCPPRRSGRRCRWCRCRDCLEGRGERRMGN